MRKEERPPAMSQRQVENASQYLALRIGLCVQIIGVFTDIPNYRSI